MATGIGVRRHMGRVACVVAVAVGRTAVCPPLATLCTLTRPRNCVPHPPFTPVCTHPVALSVPNLPSPTRTRALLSLMDQWANTSMMVVVYDVSSRDSFKSCAKWIMGVRATRTGRPIPGVLVANKTDLREVRTHIYICIYREIGAHHHIHCMDCSQNANGIRKTRLQMV